MNRDGLKMNHIPKIINSFGLSFLWTFLTSFFGLIQLWFIIAIAIWTRQTSIIKKPFDEDVLLFFIMAIITTIALDYFFDRNIKKELKKVPLILDVVFGLFVPFMAIIFTFAGYSIYLFQPGNLDYYYSSRIQLYALVISLAYVFVVKFLLLIIPIWNKK